jgi:hypothetical protein
MNADTIYVINKGQVEEKGKFTTLNRYKNFNNHEKEEEQKDPVAKDKETNQANDLVLIP